MALPIDAGVYPIDKVHSQLRFTVEHLDIAFIHGLFERFDGELVVGEELDDTSAWIDVETASINSASPFRDDALRGADWLDVDNHPLMTFRSTTATAADDGYALTGDLSIKGTTLPVTFDITYNGSAPFVFDGSTHFGFVGRAVIDRSAYGMTALMDMVGHDIELRLDLQFVRHTAATA
ncbi:MAG TPA: YceI family protein [Ilumatobacteraceae bacterium]